MAKSFPFNISKFKKTGGDKDHTILSHADGHSIKLAHSALSPDMRKAIESIPSHEPKEDRKNFDNGGQVKSGWATAKQQKDASDFSKGAQEAGSMDIAGGIKNAWNALTTPTPTNKAHGGQINPKLEESHKEPSKPHYAEGTDDVTAPVASSSSDTGIPQIDQSTSQSQASSPPIPQGNPQVADQPAVDPAIAQKRQIYNQIITGSADPSQAQNFKGLTFGEDGEAPSNLSTKAWQQTEQIYNQQQAKKNIVADAGVKDLLQQNQARQAAGLAPLPTPPAAMNQLNDQIQQNANQITGASPTSTTSSSDTAKTPADQYGINAMGDMYNQGVQEKQAGINAEATAIGNEGNAQAEALRRNIEVQHEAQQQFQNHYQALDNERKNFIDDINNNQIDPNHYMNSLGVGGRISSAIGLILGGMGGGIMHQANPALQVINQQIDRDIKAQEANLGAKQSLLHNNLQQFGNMRDATDMTRVMQMDIVSNQLKQAAATAQSPLAKAAALKASGELDMQAAPMAAQLAMRKATVNMMGSLNQDPQKTPALISMLRQSGAPGAMEQAKSLEERYVPGVGVAGVPVPAAVRENLVAKQTLQQRAQDFYNWASQHSGDLSPTDQNIGQTKAAELQSLYRNSINGGVFKKGEQEFIDKIVDSDPTKFFNSIRVLPKMKEVINSNNAQMDVLKKNYQLPTAQPQQEPQYQTRGGVKYMKVPGGWKKANG